MPAALAAVPAGLGVEPAAQPAAVLLLPLFQLGLFHQPPLQQHLSMSGKTESCYSGVQWALLSISFLFCPTIILTFHHYSILLGNIFVPHLSVYLAVHRVLGTLMFMLT